MPYPLVAGYLPQMLLLVVAELAQTLLAIVAEVGQTRTVVVAEPAQTLLVAAVEVGMRHLEGLVVDSSEVVPGLAELDVVLVAEL